MKGLRASLTFSLGRDLLFAVLVGVAALLVALSAQLEMTRQALRQRSLAGVADNIAAHFVVDSAGNGHVALARGEASTSIGYPAVVFDRDGRLIYQRPVDLDPALVDALSGQRFAPPERPEHGKLRFFSMPLGKKQIVGATLHISAGGDGPVIAVFKDETAPDVLIDDIDRDFPSHSMQVLLPLLALLLLACGAIVRRRMRPIAEVSRLAAAIGPDTLNLRLPERDVPAEVQPIVRAVNGAFARLERAAVAQREFLRRAGHQLRTPMTVLSARAALLEDDETGEHLRADIKELARIVTQLLQLNEIDALPAGDAVAEAVRDEMAARVRKHQVWVELTRPEEPVLVNGDPNVIEVAVRNLVENALENSPPGGTVATLITTDGTVAVSDTGPGVAKELREKIFEPFWTGDPQDGHAGLGLTIVRRIAERYRATATVGTAPAGGAIFVLRFALAPTRIADLDAAAAQRTLPAGLAHRRRREVFERTEG